MLLTRGGRMKARKNLGSMGNGCAEGRWEKCAAARKNLVRKRKLALSFQKVRTLGKSCSEGRRATGFKRGKKTDMPLEGPLTGRGTRRQRTNTFWVLIWSALSEPRSRSSHGIKNEIGRGSKRVKKIVYEAHAKKHEVLVLHG